MLNRRRTIRALAWCAALIAASGAHASWPGSGQLYAGGPAPGGFFPGQPGNPVGFAAAPGYPGSLTAFSGSLASNTTYSFKDFNAGTGGTNISGLTNVTFIGCRFQSNSVSNFNVQIGSSGGLVFSYCSVTPLASLYTSPPGSIWPSAGSGVNAIAFNDDVNCVSGNSGYQYGISVNSLSGTLTVDHCDIWGFGNSIVLQNTTPQINITNNWIHDAANASPQGYHTDGPGYLNGGTPPHNVLISGNTIASLGNTNALAMQNASSGYQNIVVENNYFSGFGYCVDMCHLVSGNSGLVFTGNLFGTDVPWGWGPIYTDFTSQFTASTWNNNKINIRTGTVPWTGSSPQGPSDLAWTAGEQGYFMWPNTSLHTTDFV